MDDNLKKDIMAIIADVTGFDEEEITPDTNFYTELEVDSIKAIEITVAIEKKFKISVRDEDVPGITTVRQAIETVERLIEEKASAEKK
ncbi:MAG: acyl carrier protein [Nitrospirota bacterium]